MYVWYRGRIRLTASLIFHDKCSSWLVTDVGMTKDVLYPKPVSSIVFFRLEKSGAKVIQVMMILALISSYKLSVFEPFGAEH